MKTILLLAMLLLVAIDVECQKKQFLDDSSLSFLYSCTPEIYGSDLDELHELLSEMRHHVDPETFAALCARVQEIHSIMHRSLSFSWLKQLLIEWFVHYKIDYLKTQLQDKNPYKANTASVQYIPHLSDQEIDFITLRKPSINHALKKLLGISFSKNITISFAASGGGYRAMIVTLGFMKAFEDTGILDCLMYTSSLSGSSWFMIPWIYSDLTVKDYKELLLNKIRNNYFSLQSMDVLLSCSITAFMNNIIWPKVIFDQPITSVDLFGALLAKVLLADFKDMLHKKHLSEQLNHLAQRPFPIYTAVSPFKKHYEFYDQYHYDWYEFNPIEIRNLDLNFTFSAWAFNSHFSEGKTKEIAPEQSIGYLMGIFGSAYTVNLEDIHHLYFKDTTQIPPWSNFFERIKYDFCKYIISSLSQIPIIGQTRLLAAKIPNPFKNIDAALPLPFTEKNHLTFVDAGIAYNLPGRPFLRPERHVDIIIFGDASNNVTQAKELHKFFYNASQLFGYDYQEVNVHASNNSIRFFKDPLNLQAPVIIYLTFLNDNELLYNFSDNKELQNLIHDYDLYTFDAQRCIDKEYCGTFNFTYSEHEFLQLAAIAEFNVKANKEAMINFIKQTLQ